MFEYIKQNPHEIISYIILCLFIIFIVLEAIGYYKVNYNKTNKPVSPFWLKFKKINYYIYLITIYFIIVVSGLSLLAQAFLIGNDIYKSINISSSPTPVKVLE